MGAEDGPVRGGAWRCAAHAASAWLRRTLSGAGAAGDARDTAAPVGDAPQTIPATGGTSSGTVRYGPEPDQGADLHLPEGPPAGTVVLLHGGFWLDRYDRGLMQALATDLAGRGYAACNLEYRRVGNGGGWPETFLDVAAGVDHLEHLGLAARVITLGHSAGGHLALWAAGRHRLPPAAPGSSPAVRPVGVAALSAVTDLAAAATAGWCGLPAQLLAGGTPAQVPERYRWASPAELLPLGAAQLLVHPAGDGLVPIEQSRTYAERARGAGDRVEVVEPRGDHFSVLDPGSAAWTAVVEWLRKVLGGAG